MANTQMTLGEEFPGRVEAVAPTSGVMDMDILSREGAEAVSIRPRSRY